MNLHALGRAWALALLLATVMCSGCAHSPSYDPADPLEPLNRKVYAFNTVADKYVARPLALGYEWVTPPFVRRGITNFFSNLFYPSTIVNQFLQGKFKTGLQDTGRLLINTTLGMGGFLDVATAWGLPAHIEGFGQTLGYWGVGEGWYLMLPLLGPTTNRDLVGLGVDIPLNPLYWYEGDSSVSLAITGLDTLQLRAQLLKADRILATQPDPYVFVRSAFLQQRWSLIHDGSPPPEDDEFGDFDEFDDGAFEDF